MVPDVESTERPSSPEVATGTAEVADFRRTFRRWGIGTFLLVVGALLALSLRRTGGTLIYLIDDPAIHLSLAENLVHHGTWGVVPGQFQSASSSPLWTLLLSAWVALASLVRHLGIPLNDDVGPLILNIVIGIWVIDVIARRQRVLAPSFRRPLDAAAVAGLIVGVLFLPALVMLGMEHLLQIGIVLTVVGLFERGTAGSGGIWRRVLPYLLVGVMVLVRFEGLFVAAAIGVALLAASVPGLSSTASPPPWRGQLVKAVWVGVAAVGAFGAFAAFNVLMGQGVLPNSVLAKGQGVSGDAGAGLQLRAIVERLTSDPLLAAMFVVVAAAVMVGWRQRRRYTFVAIVFLVATALHVIAAQVGWFERYQAYLVALGVVTLLAIADETVPWRRRAPARAFLVPGIALVALLLCSTKISLTVEVRKAVADTYQQRYQAARFLAEYYDGEPVATTELGYISLLHEGPLTDFFGLGDYEVLQGRRAMDQRPTPEFWEQIRDERGFKVAVFYPVTLTYQVPEDWVHVASFTMDHAPVTAYQSTLEVWATDPSEVEPLTEKLRSFEPELPPGATLTFVTQPPK